MRCGMNRLAVRSPYGALQLSPLPLPAAILGLRPLLQRGALRIDRSRSLGMIPFGHAKCRLRLGNCSVPLRALFPPRRLFIPVL